MKNLLLKCHYILVVVLLLSSVVVNAQEIQKGRLEKFEYKDSKIFLGTVRTVTVYIPQQIDPSIPACVHIQQDGLDPNSRFNNVFDTLIQNKEMPVTVGIFINSGSMPQAKEGSLSRPNRCFEYDGVGDNYARFLLEEMIPYVAAKYKLNLSNSGNDRSIGGCSSGGIAAFNAAWERPDAFTRVYCTSGSFVAFRGGHEFPTMIRKTDPKPIRSYITTATYDMENCAGDWYLLDLEIEKALKFSGYDYQFKLIANGGHCSGNYELFGTGMRYLWKGWPTAVKAGQGAPRVSDVIIPNETWSLVKGGFTNAGGAACNIKGEVFFTDAPGSKIYKIDSTGKVSTFLENSGNSNSLSFGANGELYSVSAKSGKLMSYDVKGSGKQIEDGIFGQYILARPDGGLYVTTGNDEAQKGNILLIKDGVKTMLDAGIAFSSGVAMSPDRWLLAVADNVSHWVYSYEIAAGGKLINKERFFWLHVQDWEDNSGAEAICYDKEGHLYVATKMGVQICTWDGPTQVILPVPGNQKITGVCIGGANMDILFAFCGDKIYKRKIKNHAIGAFTPVIKMTQGKL
jgi:gluconolactonase